MWRAPSPRRRSPRFARPPSRAQMRRSRCTSRRKPLARRIGGLAAIDALFADQALLGPVVVLTSSARRSSCLVGAPLDRDRLRRALTGGLAGELFELGRHRSVDVREALTIELEHLRADVVADPVSCALLAVHDRADRVAGF